MPAKKKTAKGGSKKPVKKAKKTPKSKKKTKSTSSPKPTPAEQIMLPAKTFIEICNSEPPADGIIPETMIVTLLPGQCVRVIADKVGPGESSNSPSSGPTGKGGG